MLFIALAPESELLYEMSRAYHGSFDSQASAVEATLKVFNFGIVFKMDLDSHIISFTFFISLNIKFSESILKIKYESKSIVFIKIKI